MRTSCKQLLVVRQTHFVSRLSFPAEYLFVECETKSQNVNVDEPAEAHCLIEGGPNLSFSSQTPDGEWKGRTVSQQRVKLGFKFHIRYEAASSQLTGKRHCVVAHTKQLRLRRCFNFTVISKYGRSQYAQSLKCGDQIFLHFIVTFERPLMLCLDLGVV